jgi:carotenoid cleavage dioxygenase-like enzyme
VTETPILTYFDPATLDTQERLHLGHAGEAMHLMSAHGYTLPDGSYLNVATALGPKCVMKLFRLGPGGTRTEVIARIGTPKAGYTHGFGLAPGHAILWETAMRVQALALRFGKRSYAHSFRWEPDAGSALHAVALGSGAVRTWRIPPMMAFHATQAWLDGSDLVLDVAVYDDGTVFDDLYLAPRRADAPMRSHARHVRYRLRDGRAEAQPEPLPGPPIELQQVHPARLGAGRARVCWGMGNDGENRFAASTHRIDLDSGAVATWQRPGAAQLEPLFVPRPGGSDDDDGVLLVPTLAPDDAASVIGVVDARTMEGVAELRAPQIVPFGFHAAWRPA